jgi:hypothetical protein
MAKKSMIGRDVKRFVLITKYQLKRNSLKDTIKKAKSIEEKICSS